MLLSILARHQTVSLLKILCEVALVVHAHLDDDLLISEERRLQKFARLFDPQFLEIADRRHACFRFEQMLQTRVGKINRRRHPADRQMPVKISAHSLYYFNYSWIHVPKMSFRYGLQCSILSDFEHLLLRNEVGHSVRVLIPGSWDAKNLRNTKRLRVWEDAETRGG